MKSPYEIRLDVLLMAKDMIEKEAETLNKTASRSHNPVTANVDSVISRANELYAFVTNDSKEKK